jgi:hypothetical protein
MKVWFNYEIGLSKIVKLFFYSMFSFASLPQTVEMKMIDIWMLATFIYPFLVISVQTAIYLAVHYQWKTSVNLVKWLKLVLRVILPFVALVFVLSYFIHASSIRHN